MPYIITKENLTTHIYEEIIDEISRATDDIVNKAISAGIGEAKSYLSKYNLTILFGSSDPDITTTFEDDNLIAKTVDIICWQFIRLSNPNIELALFRTAYEDALKWLRDVQSGRAEPDGWTYKTVDAEGFDEGSSVTFGSNRKLHQHY
jgi:hypothetical protein